MAITPYSSNIASNYTTQYESNRVNESMTSGRQVNRAADNAAGLAIINAMNTQSQTMDVGSQNALMGISLLQTADGAASGLTENLQRMRELSLQAQNGTLNDAQRGMLNQEFQQLYQGMQDISQNTKFNGQALMNGDVTSMNIQVGESASELALPNLSGANLAIDSLSINSASGATTALDAIDQAMETLASTRAEYGAQQNGLMSAYDNLQSQNINIQASRSQIEDTDFAQAITEQNRLNILSQAQIAMQAQGNQQKASVLQLLNG
ncbi:flagellin [Thiomicrorhabdus indica]|uniref:flagellin n=1 Tax=Thiomicrorhabdus indica TaxID=2267253 RepID=UPI00102DFE8F|nr:flagellin [Thiomicrorhabdus indica]